MGALKKEKQRYPPTVRAYLEDFDQIKEVSTGRVTFKGSIGTKEAKRGEKSFWAKGTTSAKSLREGNTRSRECEEGPMGQEPQEWEGIFCKIENA